MPLGVPLPGWPWELVVTAMDMWEGCFVLRGTEALDPTGCFREPGSWGIMTDRGTVHIPGGGGGHTGGATYSYWHRTFVPSLPDDATAIRVFVGPSVPELGPGAPLPDEPILVVGLRGWPATPTRAEAKPRRTPPNTPGPGPLPGLDHRPVRPDSVIPISARLEDLLGDDVLGREVCVLSLETWPTGFDLHLGGSGGWALVGGSLGRRRCSAQDDRGRRYRCRPGGVSSGPTWSTELSFVPPLDPAATALTLELPHPLDDAIVVRATIDLTAPS